jgi:hypothetical protein
MARSASGSAITCSGGAFAHHPARLDHHHPVGQKLRLVHVMGDQHHRHRQMGAQRDDLAVQPLARGAVHGRERLIQQQRLRAAGQCAGDGNTLLLTP